MDIYFKNLCFAPKIMKKKIFLKCFKRKMEHIKLFSKFAPVYSVAYWSIFVFFIYKSKMRFEIRKYHCIEVKNGAKDLLL